MERQTRFFYPRASSGDNNDTLLNLERDTTAQISLVGSANFPTAANLETMGQAARCRSTDVAPK